MRLPVQFLGSSSSSYSRGGSYRNRDQPNMFAWTIFITLLMVVAGGTWLFSLMVLSFPEKAWTYKILSKFDKLPDIKTYSATSVPSGKFHSARDLYALFSNLYIKDREQFDGANDRLKRNYIRNFTDESPVYLKGSVRTHQVRALDEGDVFQKGIVYRANSFEVSNRGTKQEELVFPDAVIEYILPASESPSGELSHTKDVVFNASAPAALIHVAMLPDERMSFTFVPLIHDEFKVDAETSLKLAPPARLNLTGSWPLTDDGRGDTSSNSQDSAPPPQIAEK